MTPDAILSKLCKICGETRFNFTTEAELQNGVATLLEIHGLPFTREYRLSPKSRVDFFLDRYFLDNAATGPGAGVGIETKIDGSLAEVTRQIHRYMQCPQIEALVVLSRRVNVAAIPDTINGKPVKIITLWEQGL